MTDILEDIFDVIIVMLSSPYFWTIGLGMAMGLLLGYFIF